MEGDGSQEADEELGMDDLEGPDTETRSVSSCSHVAVKAVESEAGSVAATPSEASTTSEEQSPLDTPGGSSGSDVKGTSIEEDGAVLGRCASAESWVEVEHGPDWDLEDADQGLLKQRQKDRTPPKRKWFYGLV
jgi:hypothetical protein